MLRSNRCYTGQVVGLQWLSSRSRRRSSGIRPTISAAPQKEQENFSGFGASVTAAMMIMIVIIYVIRARRGESIQFDSIPFDSIPFDSIQVAALENYF